MIGYQKIGPNQLNPLRKSVPLVRKYVGKPVPAGAKYQCLCYNQSLEKSEVPLSSENSQFSFVAAEHEILLFWKDQEIFEKSLMGTESGKPYVFYDGPPFAT